MSSLGGTGAPRAGAAQAVEEPAPGVAAPPATRAELQALVALAVQRFEAKDAGGVLVHVSEQYRTGPLTKPAVRDQLAAIFGVYDAVRARVRIDDVRIVGEHAWVYSTGEVSGRLPLIGRWTPIIWWEKELEVARRENGVWRLFGYQQ